MWFSNIIKSIAKLGEKYYIKDTYIRNKFHKGFKRKTPPTTIIIHGTGGTGTYKWMKKGERGNNYRKGISLFHYLIERDGRIINIINPNRWVWHSHAGWHRDKNGNIIQRDASTIGIELENTSSKNTNGYTKEQYDSLSLLVFDNLMIKYPINIIMSHSRSYKKYLKKTKPLACPGPKFDWSKINEQLELNNYSYNDKTKESYWAIKSII